MNGFLQLVGFFAIWCILPEQACGKCSRTTFPTGLLGVGDYVYMRIEKDSSRASLNLVDGYHNKLLHFEVHTNEGCTQNEPQYVLVRTKSQDTSGCSCMSEKSVESSFGYEYESGNYWKIIAQQDHFSFQYYKDNQLTKEFDSFKFQPQQLAAVNTIRIPRAVVCEGGSEQYKPFFFYAKSIPSDFSKIIIRGRGVASETGFSHSSGKGRQTGFEIFADGSRWMKVVFHTYSATGSTLLIVYKGSSPMYTRQVSGYSDDYYLETSIEDIGHEYRVISVPNPGNETHNKLAFPKNLSGKKLEVRVYFKETVEFTVRS